MSHFVWSDAWLLLSLIYARREIDRKTILRVGDFINHAIFTEEELEGGLQRLCATGHVLERKQRFRPSSEVLEWYRRTSPKPCDAYEDLERVEEFLGVDRKV